MIQQSYIGSRPQMFSFSYILGRLYTFASCNTGEISDWVEAEAVEHFTDTTQLESNKVVMHRIKICFHMKCLSLFEYETQTFQEEKKTHFKLLQHFLL